MTRSPPPPATACSWTSSPTCATEGMGLEELAAWAEEHKHEVRHWFFSTDLTFFVQAAAASPRLISGLVGGVLKICPVHGCGARTARSRSTREDPHQGRRSIARVVEKMSADSPRTALTTPVKCFISQSECLDDAQRGCRSASRSASPSCDGKVADLPHRRHHRRATPARAPWPSSSGASAALSEKNAYRARSGGSPTGGPLSRVRWRALRHCPPPRRGAAPRARYALARATPPPRARHNLARATPPPRARHNLARVKTRLLWVAFFMFIFAFTSN